MAFDVQRFAQAQFKPREQSVPVPALEEFFGPGEPAEWRVRSLTASEFYRAGEAKQRQEAVSSVAEALASNREKAAELRKVLGLSGAATPGEVAKRLEMLVDGSVCPQIDLATAVLLAERFPVEFITITNAITELTGQGAELVKPAAASQKTTASSLE